MNILYIHQFFAGPESPGPHQPRDLVRVLAERGHQVEVVACDLNAYNEQTEPEEAQDFPGGGSVRVHRLPVPRNLRASLANRLKTYGLFAWRAYRFGRKMPRPDLVMATIQPLFGGWSAFRLARKWRVPFFLEVRDLWPDALVVKKAIRPWQAVPLQRIAQTLYTGADRVAVLTPGLKTELLKKNVPADRLDLFPNSYNEEFFRLEPGTRERMRGKLGWDGQFVAVYVGSLTEVTAVETLVRAGAFLKERGDIRIDIFGSGQSKPNAMALARQQGLGNVHFHDSIPKSQVPAILAAADAGVMTLFRSPLIHIYFENKFIDYMGAGLPIVASLDGVQVGLLRDSGAGLVVPTFDAEALAKGLLELAQDPEKGRRMGAAGRQYISTRLAQPDILNHYANVLEAVAQGRADEMPTCDPFAFESNRPKCKV